MYETLIEKKKTGQLNTLLKLLVDYNPSESPSTLTFGYLEQQVWSLENNPF